MTKIIAIETLIHGAGCAGECWDYDAGSSQSVMRALKLQLARPGSRPGEIIWPSCQELLAAAKKHLGS